MGAILSGSRRSEGCTTCSHNSRGRHSRSSSSRRNYQAFSRPRVCTTDDVDLDRLDSDSEVILHQALQTTDAETTASVFHISTDNNITDLHSLERSFRDHSSIAHPTTTYIRSTTSTFVVQLASIAEDSTTVV